MKIYDGVPYFFHSCVAKKVTKAIFLIGYLLCAFFFVLLSVEKFSRDQRKKDSREYPFFIWPLPFSLSVFISSWICRKVFERSEKKGKQRVPILYLAVYTAAFLSLCFSLFSDLSKRF